MNDFFRFFDKLDVLSKTSIISIAVLMPFWYISIYLINKELFLSLDLVLRIAFSFCFSLVYYFLQVYLAFITSSVNQDDDSENIIKYAGVLAVLSLCLSIVFHYHKRVSYEEFIYSSLIILVVVNLGSLSYTYFQPKYNKWKQRKSKS